MSVRLYVCSTNVCTHCDARCCNVCCVVMKSDVMCRAVPRRAEPCRAVPCVAVPCHSNSRRRDRRFARVLASSSCTLSRPEVLRLLLLVASRCLTDGFPSILRVHACGAVHASAESVQLLCRALPARVRERERERERGFRI